MNKKILSTTIIIVLLIFSILFFTNCKNESLDQKSMVPQEDEKFQKERSEEDEGKGQKDRDRIQESVTTETE